MIRTVEELRESAIKQLEKKMKSIEEKCLYAHFNKLDFDIAVRAMIKDNPVFSGHWSDPDAANYRYSKIQEYLPIYENYCRLLEGADPRLILQEILSED